MRAGELALEEERATLAGGLANNQAPQSASMARHNLPPWVVNSPLQIQVEWASLVNNQAAVPICDGSIYGLYKLNRPNRVRFYGLTSLPQ